MDFLFSAAAAALGGKKDGGHNSYSNSDSKFTAAEEVNTEVESGGFHLLEIHLPTLQIGGAAVVAVAIVIGLLYCTYSHIRRRGERRRQRRQEEKQWEDVKQRWKGGELGVASAPAVPIREIP